MGEGFEILLWLALMAILGLRGAAQSRKRAEREAPEEAESLGGGSAPNRIDPDEGAIAGSTERASGARGGLLSRMAEVAAELERQARERQTEAEARRAREEAALARRAGGERRHLGVDRERTVVVPGRRVRPPPPAGGRLEARDPSGPPATAVASEEGRRRSRRHGLERLERYPTLQRAILLSELLGPAPGLAPGGASETGRGGPRTGPRASRSGEESDSSQIRP